MNEIAQGDAPEKGAVGPTESPAPRDPPLTTDGRRIPRWLFMRALGVIHVVAFGSLWRQLEALSGSTGVVPAADYVSAVQRAFETRTDLSWMDFPSLALWFGASDAVLHAMCAAGVTLGLVMVVGFVPRVTALGLWLLYFSLQLICRPFLNYQWDILLLETTLMAAIYAPAGLWPRIKGASEPSPAVVWMMRLLLFKLVLSSGVVKINSGDVNWRELTALDYHFWTQPIPHQMAWYAHNVPEWIRPIGVWLNHVIELWVPILIIFNPRRWLLVGWLVWAGWDISQGVGTSPWDEVAWAVGVAAILGGRIWPHGVDHSPARWPAAVLIGGLMASIGFTGNYGFFNVLTVALCIPLLDDRCIRWVTPFRWRHRWPIETGPKPHPIRRYFVIGAAVLASFFCAIQMVSLIPRTVRGEVRQAMANDDARLDQRALATMLELHGEASETFGRLATFYNYGLFARMTDERFELQIEGSVDQVTWRPYRFHYKPDTPDDPLVFAGLHMPRMDWQMWFTALRPQCPSRSDWFNQFLRQILEGAPAVKGVFAENPFPDTPPRYVRVKRFRVTFTNSEERAATGAIWHFEPAGIFCPVRTAGDFRRARR